MTPEANEKVTQYIEDHGPEKMAMELFTAACTLVSCADSLDAIKPELGTLMNFAEQLFEASLVPRLKAAA